VASVEQCRAVLETLADRLHEADSGLRERRDLDRTLALQVRDLDVVFTGRLHEGQLTDIEQLPAGTGPNGAQVVLSVTSDDLLALTDGKLNFPVAWATGRVRVDASVMDILRLRTLL
jgi:putative sterol carrier protein